MSEQNRRRLRFTVQGVLLIAVVAMGVLSFMPPPSVTPASAQTSPAEEIDPVVYSAVQRLRRELALTNRDLAAMGCTQAQAEATLNALKDWYETNAAALGRAKANVRSAERDLRMAMKRYYQGPRDEALIASLPGLRSAVSATQARRKATIDAAIPTVQPHLPSGQSTLWATARANTKRHSDLRYIANLTDQTSSQYESTLRKRRRAGESTDAVQQRVLAVSQRTEVTTVRDRINTNLPGVLAAEEAVLPAPLEEVDAPITP